MISTIDEDELNVPLMSESSLHYRRIRAIGHNPKINNDESVEIDLPIEKIFIGKGAFAIVYKTSKYN